MIRVSHIATLAVLGSALLASGCSDSEKPSSASTTAKPAPSTTTPVTTAPSTAASKPATPAAPATTAPASTAPAAADVAKLVDNLPPVPTQDEVDATVQKAITDANADSEFDKLSKEIDSDKP